MTGNELKKWREKMDTGQENLARVLEVSNSTVARWEQLKDKEIPNGKMLDNSLEKISLDKLKEFIQSTTEDSLLRAVSFDFNSISAWKGWLQVRLSNSFIPMETALNSEILKKSGFEMKESPVLKKNSITGT